MTMQTRTQRIGITVLVVALAVGILAWLLVPGGERILLIVLLLLSIGLCVGLATLSLKLQRQG